MKVMYLTQNSKVNGVYLFRNDKVTVLHEDASGTTIECEAGTIKVSPAELSENPLPKDLKTAVKYLKKTI